MKIFDGTAMIRAVKNGCWYTLKFRRGSIRQIRELLAEGDTHKQFLWDEKNGELYYYGEDTNLYKVNFEKVDYDI